jgi:hypothetical protein
VLRHLRADALQHPVALQHMLLRSAFRA